jgi:hypothetical protein
LSTRTFEAQLAALDRGLFARIDAQLTDDDKGSLLAVHHALREQIPGYVYLEIGSHLGGSIQPHVQDARCARIISIDKRPTAVPDDRGYDVPYPENSTAHMLSLLRAISPDADARITCFDEDASGIAPDRLPERPHLCFIDGEHTERAAMADYAFCRKVIRDNGVILFHDANVIYTGLVKIIAQLEAEKAEFRAYVLPSSIFVLTLGKTALHTDPAIAGMLLDNHRQYLFGLMSLEHYREVYNRRPVRIMRTIWQTWLKYRRKLG